MIKKLLQALKKREDKEPEIAEPELELRPGWVMIKRRLREGSLPLIQPVEIVKENKKTVWVRLPSGHVIKRRRQDVGDVE